MPWLITFLYVGGLLLVTLCALGQLHLLFYLARARRRRSPRTRGPLLPADPTLPRVTVQLPIYNEVFVAAEAIDALAGLDWPADRLEIQVLDDSTDETVDIVRRRVEYWQMRGIDVCQIRRRDRTGYKAGALAAGLEQATGEYMAIFDADFRPQPDFLLRAMPHFDDAAVGFVQARWGHANRTESLLTRVEAVVLDVQFLIGQPAREEAGCFLRFNGSAGIWRRTCIEQAGGWSAETLAEDLDLCFRAQLAGWQGRYAGDVVADAELPRTLEDFRSQQMRWVRGTAQVMRKLGPSLARARIPALVKAHAWLDLLTVIAVLPILATALLSLPMAWMLHSGGGALRDYVVDTSFALIPQVSWLVSLVVVASQQDVRLRRWVAAPVLFFPILFTILGLMPSLGAAAADGLLRRGGEFVRTPKFGASAALFGGPRPHRLPAGEAVMLVYSAIALAVDLRIGAYDFVFLHVTFVVSLLAVLAASMRVRHSARSSPDVQVRRRLPGLPAATLTALLLAGGPAGRAAGQTSLVPARHPVYEWLHRQRVLDRVDGYAHGVLPLSRGEIASQLAILGQRDDLGATDRFLLSTYQREFSPEGLVASANENLLRGTGSVRERVTGILRDYREPHVFAAVEDGYALALDLTSSFGVASLDEGGDESSAWLLARGVRAYADFYGHAGVHLEAGNIEARGDREVLSLDPVYGRTFEIVGQGKNNSNYFETSISGRYRALSAHLGHGALRFGPGPAEPIWLSRDASTFDWLRLDIDTRYFRYVALHGSLAADAADGLLIVDGTDSLATRVAPQRWLALHRLELVLPGDLRVGVSELIAYSARGIDLAYINPMTPLFFAELDNQDRDNAVLGLDLTWRPVAGLELHGGVFVDDAVDQSDIVAPTGTPDATRAFDVGLTAAHPAGIDGGLRYVRMEPFVYSHVQSLNALEQRGFPLGNALGPNADAAQVWARLWLPRRTAVGLSLARSRKGLNPIDADGRVIENVGGDFSQERGQRPYRFLESADVQRWTEIALEADTEPWRGFRFSVRLTHRDVSAGDRIRDRTFLDARLRVGL